MHLVSSGYLSCTFIVLKAHEGDLKLNYHKGYEKSDSNETPNEPKNKQKKQISDVPISVNGESGSKVSDDTPKKEIRSLRGRADHNKNRRSSFFQNNVIDIATSSGPRNLGENDGDEKAQAQTDQGDLKFISENSKEEETDPSLLYLIEISCKIQDGFTVYTVDQNLTCDNKKKMFNIEFTRENRREVQSLIFSNAFEGRKSYVTDEFSQEYTIANSLPLMIANNTDCRLIIKASSIVSVFTAIALLIIL